MCASCCDPLPAAGAVSTITLPVAHRHPGLPTVTPRALRCASRCSITCIGNLFNVTGQHTTLRLCVLGSDGMACPHSLSRALHSAASPRSHPSIPEGPDPVVPAHAPIARGSTASLPRIMTRPASACWHESGVPTPRAGAPTGAHRLGLQGRDSCGGGSHLPPRPSEPRSLLTSQIQVTLVAAWLQANPHPLPATRRDAPHVHGAAAGTPAHLSGGCSDGTRNLPVPWKYNRSARTSMSRITDQSPVIRNIHACARKRGQGFGMRCRVHQSAGWSPQAWM